jgi:16S rRNA processing protein RimM
VELFIDRARLPAAGNGEFYHADLIGLAAVGAGGQRIGEIVAVQNFGAGDLLEIHLADTGKTKLVPFTEAMVPEVDVAGGQVVVVMPEGDDA